METNFSDIQQLWQSQKAKELDLNLLMQQMNKVEKKQKLEWMLALILTPITIVFLAIFLPLKDSVLGSLSLILIGLGMGWVIYLSSKSKLSAQNNPEVFSNQEFIKSQIKKLSLRNRIIRKHMISYGLILILAINLAYLAVLEPLSTGFRISAHLGASLMIVVIMLITIRRKSKKYDQELKPIIKHLESLLMNS
ncbi:hypothetical protein [Algoriphagus marinus]|uniref:hypothetical protein n=1 Tax=Algoriphagus marinus TaxID=1925762 RepID=UPI00094BB5DD|nr:hypothetical protein [Algoriphagus marinus]